jgi:SpoVK/Ycf46/Vps4 family AAA+-type ATPase
VSDWLDRWLDGEEGEDGDEDAQEVSLDEIVSKYIGDTERNLAEVFARRARHRQSSLLRGGRPLR